MRKIQTDCKFDYPHDELLYNIAEIVMFEGLTCVYRSNIDLYFYVIGSSSENELILVSVLNAFYDCISQILRKSVEKKMLMDNLDVIMLAMDELVDGG